MTNDEKDKDNRPPGEPRTRLAAGLINLCALSLALLPQGAFARPSGFFLSHVLSCRQGDAKIALVARIFRSKTRAKTKLIDIRASGRVGRDLYLWQAKVDTLTGTAQGTGKTKAPLSATLKFKAKPLEGTLAGLSIAALHLTEAVRPGGAVRARLEFEPSNQAPSSWSQFDSCTKEEAWPFVLEALAAR